MFIGVLRGIAKFEGSDSQFRSWVFTIAHRRLLDGRRRAANRPISKPLSADVDPGAPDDVHGEVDEALSTERIMDLCHRPVPDERNVRLLRMLGQLSLEEVALTLNKTAGAVRSLQHRGLAAVGRLLEQEGVSL